MMVIGGRYGVPYLYEKYGMPTKAVVTKVDGSMSKINVHYEFSVDGDIYRGGMFSKHVSVGDTICVWYLPFLPWLNDCHEESLLR